MSTWFMNAPLLESWIRTDSSLYFLHLSKLSLSLPNHNKTLRKKKLDSMFCDEDSKNLLLKSIAKLQKLVTGTSNHPPPSNNYASSLASTFFSAGISRLRKLCANSQFPGIFSKQTWLKVFGEIRCKNVNNTFIIKREFD